jgi:ketosteroid isomerase-like protein
MNVRTTTEVIDRFNQVFVDHDVTGLDDLIGEDCLMEAVQPAPTGERVEGREACLAWWGALAADRAVQFTPEETIIAADRATIRWNYRFGDGPADWVAGVTLLRVRDGLIVEALGYSKTAGEVPLTTST